MWKPLPLFMGDLEPLLHLLAAPSSPVSQAEGRGDGKLLCSQLIPYRRVYRGAASRCRKVMEHKANPAHTIFKAVERRKKLRAGWSPTGGLNFCVLRQSSMFRPDPH